MSTRRIYAFAHRGGRAHERDNTLAAFRTALHRGATGLETDAWITADGVVVLDHDGVHREARRRHKPMSAVRRDELQEHVPSLLEVYAACGTEFDLAVDVREREVAAPVVEAASAAGAAARLWLFAPSAELLPAWQRLSPDVHLACTLNARSRTMRNVMAARDAGAEAVNLRALWWTRSFVQRVHEAGLLAFAYDAQTTWSLRRAVRQGVDGLFSDHVDRMTDAIAAGAG